MSIFFKKIISMFSKISQEKFKERNKEKVSLVIAPTNSFRILIFQNIFLCFAM